MQTRRASLVLLLTAVVSLGSPAFSEAQVIERQPLAPRVHTGAPALFTSLDPRATGLDFRYDWDPPEQYEHEMVNGITGGGVCLGDYDGDGRVDVFLTQPFKGNRLYRNLGDWKFLDVTEAAGLTKEHLWGTGASFADTDNDGDLDLFVCGYDSPNRFYVNQGDGTFVENAAAAGLAYRGASVMVAFADYDLDGHLDAYLCNNHIAPLDPPLWEYEKDARGMPILPPELKGIAKPLYRPDLRDGMLIPAGESDRLYHNNGDGTFTNISEKAGIGDEDFGLSVTWWDFDHDGDPDIYNANDFYGADHLYQNNGDGTFTDVNQLALPHTPWFSMGTDVADINNDGLLDFMASDMLGTTHYKQKISMGDMQGWFLETAVPRQYMRNALYINTGELRFQEGAFLAGVASTDWTWSLKFADFDSDGLTDLYVTNGAERYWDHSDIMQSARGAQRIDTPELKRVWLNSPQRNDPNLAFRNLGDLEFENVSEAWGLDAAKVSYGAALGDLDGDGDLDLVVNHFEDHASLYRNESHENQLAAVVLEGTRSNHLGLDAILEVSTASGRTQALPHTLTRGFMSANAPGLTIGLGNEARFDLTVSWSGGARQILRGLEAGNRYRIREPDEARGSRKTPDPVMFGVSDALRAAMVAEEPFDDFAREPLLPAKLSQLGPGMAWGDLDGDGDDDLVLGRPAGRPTEVFRTGPGRFDRIPAAAFEAHAACEDMAPLLFDADGDGDVDLLVLSGGVEAEAGSEAYRDRLYLNDGTGEFVSAPSENWPDIRTNSGAAAAADIDRDGDLDVFVGSRVRPGRYPMSDPSRLMRNEGGGRFTDASAELAPDLGEAGLVTSALFSDADGDGWVDLLIAREWGPLTLLLNREGKFVDAGEKSGMAALSGWWNSVAAGDFNHDGAMDYVVGNAGLNSKYHADPEHPARLYYGDMDGSGRSQIIEAKVHEGTWLPVRGKSCSQNAMPALRDRFPTFESFASATLGEIYPQQRLQDARLFEATELRSGIFLNRGDGTFRFLPLPRAAQISPGFGLAVTEVDGDGNPDIYMVQNSFGPQPETGRMDGGMSQLLLGEGDGHFRPVPVHRSGLIVSGDGKSLGAVDLNQDGWVDFVAACNSGPLPVFIHRGGGPNRPLSVRVQGPVGNPTGAGTRVTLTGKGMTPQMAELASGGGYLSQNPALLFFGVPAGAEPESLRIRWPDGEETSVGLAGSVSRRLLIRHPAASPDSAR